MTLPADACKSPGGYDHNFRVEFVYDQFMKTKYSIALLSSIVSSRDGGRVFSVMLYTKIPRHIPVANDPRAMSAPRSIQYRGYPATPRIYYRWVIYPWRNCANLGYSYLKTAAKIQLFALDQEQAPPQAQHSRTKNNLLTEDGNS